MSKSLLAIGALGAAACLVMSLMMQHLLEVKQQRDKSPLELELEARFEGRLVGPVKVVTEQDAGKTRLRVQLSVLAGLRKDRVAEAVGTQTWDLVQGTAVRPHEVVVEVGDEDRGPVTTKSVPRPPRRR